MADRLRQVLLEAFSNSGRPLRRIDRANVMIGIFAREGSVVEWRAWNWTEIQAPTTSPGSPWRSSCRTYTRTRRIASDKGSPDACRRDIRIADCKSDPRFPTPRCRLLAYSGTRRSTFPFQVLQNPLALSAPRTKGACRRSATDGPQFCLFKSLAHGFGGSYRPSEIPCR